MKRIPDKATDRGQYHAYWREKRLLADLKDVLEAHESLKPMECYGDRLKYNKVCDLLAQSVRVFEEGWRS